MNFAMNDDIEKVQKARHKQTTDSKDKSELDFYVFIHSPQHILVFCLSSRC